MKVEIKSIADKGDSEKERLVLRVIQEVNIGQFFVLCTGFSEGQINTGIRNTFWFPDKEVNAGDLVVLYTKPGKANEKTQESGAKSHFFYWGLSEPQWKIAERGVVLLHAPMWQGAGASEV
jgi:hypothetical protein